MTKIIRAIDSNGQVQSNFWTGSQFSEDINQAKIYTSPREISNDIKKAYDFLNVSLAYNERILRPFISDPVSSSEEVSFVKSINDSFSKNLAQKSRLSSISKMGHGKSLPTDVSIISKVIDVEQDQDIYDPEYFDENYIGDPVLDGGEASTLDSEYDETLDGGSP